MAKTATKTQKRSAAMRAAIGLALGGGAARGLAHIPILEALDELGLKPGIIAGTSIGSIVGAAYASGMTGKDMRDYVKKLFGNRTELFRRIATRWPGALGALWNPFTPAMFNGETLIELLLPETLPLEFENLAIPFLAIATDFHAEEQVIFESGPLMPAIAASSALPALLKPVQIGDRILIDGGFVNPTPFDVIRDRADIVIAVDVTGAPKKRPGRTLPNSFDTWLGAAQITLHSIVREKLKSIQPDILIRPEIGGIGALDFFKTPDILQAGDAVKDDFKRQLAARLDARATNRHR